MNIEEIKDRVNLTKNAFHKLGIEGQVNINVMLNDIEFLLKEIEGLKEDNKKKSIVIIEYQDLYEKLEDKIKAKIEEWQKEKEFYNKDEDREWGQFNNWDWTDTIINEMQSLLEKE